MGAGIGREGYDLECDPLVPKIGFTNNQHFSALWMCSDSLVKMLVSGLRPTSQLNAYKRPPGTILGTARGRRNAATNLCKRDFSRPGKPTDNAYVESFNGTLRAECFDVHWFATLTEAKQVIESWRREYNDSRPHRSLGERTPSEFACQIALNGDLPSSQTVRNSP